MLRLIYGTETQASIMETTAVHDLLLRNALIFDGTGSDPMTGDVVPRGTPGELCTRGYSVMLGYWDQPDKTSEAIDPDGWMHTGDLSEMRQDGYANIVGRIKDLVIRGGENVYPADVAAVLARHPHVTAAAAVGVPDPDWGQRLVAFAEASVPAEALTAWLAAEVARHQRPRAILLLDALPLTPIGKVDRQALRRLAMNIVMD